MTRYNIKKVLIFTAFLASVLFVGDNFYRYFYGENRALCQSTHKSTSNLSVVIPKQPFSYLDGAPLSKDLVVHTAYYDNRARNGYSNSTMIIVFVVVNRALFDSKLVVGCGVGNVQAEKFLVRFVAEDIKLYELHLKNGPGPFKYIEIAVECYDLPANNGDRVTVTYKTTINSIIELVVESEYPLVVPSPRIKPKGKHNFTVLTCTKVHDKGVNYLEEFIRYQKTIGVDHVHISILDTFIKDGGFQDHLLKEPFFRQVAEDGYVTFSVWKEWYDEQINKEVYLHSEILRKLDCIYRFRGTYDYAFPLDTDDFFVPRVPGMTDLKDYIRNYCYQKPAASCVFKWITYYPDICGMNGAIGKDGNVTSKLKSYKAKVMGNPKSVHRTNVLVDSTFHSAECDGCLMPGYKSVAVPSNIAYMVGPGRLC